MVKHVNTVNPRLSPLGAFLFFMLFGWGLIQGGSYSRGRLIQLFDKCCIKSSLSKLLFSVLLQEQSKCRHYSLSKSLSLFGVGAYLRGAY